MEHTSLKRAEVAVDVENVGGIDDSRVEFTPGVTVLAGRNATNRTSFLRAVMAALGSDQASLKSDAEAGRVELSIGDECYTRTFERRNGTVTTGGDPYLDDPTLADLFAFLLETNEARQAVAQGADLRELMMRPIDTEAIRAEIERLRARKESLQGELDELDELGNEQTRLESKRTRLESELEELREEREAKADALDSADRDVDETRSEKAELEETLEELNEVRSELESVRFEIETQRDSIDNLRTERESLREELGDDDAMPADEIGRIDGRLDALRERQGDVETLVNDLQRIVRFNEEMLEGTDSEIAAALEDETADPTEQLLAEERVVCWTCGSDVETDRIEETIDRLQSVRAETVDRRRELRSEISELSERKRDLERDRRAREKSRDRLDRIEREIDEREASLEDRREEREKLADRVGSLEDRVEELDVVDEHQEMLADHRELNQLEFEIDRLEDDRASVDDRIDEIDERLAERSRLESQVETVADELADQRTEIERIEREAVDHFNEHMDAVLDILEYENLDRIWIERTTTQAREGRRTVERSTFDLHVVRSTDADVAYEDSIDHLSESEREVTGLVFALAGYLVHDVYETVPFMLLDSLEAIDADRIARLVDYVSTYADSLVVALLPEDAAALDDEYERVTEI